MLKKMFQAYSHWRNLCRSIVSLKREGQGDQALQMMQEQLPEATQQLESAIKYIADFANAKASEFYTLTLERKKDSLVTFTTLLTITIAGSLVILFLL